MGLKVLGISTSPRIKGNSDILLCESLSAVEAVGCETEYLSLNKLNIHPCISCGRCEKLGHCAVEDDYQAIMAKMLDADCMIFATPIYFMSVCAQAKALIDRCQCLWARKYVLKHPTIDTPHSERRAMVIAVGGSRSKNMFPGIELTMKYFFDVLDMKYMLNLFVNQVDKKGDIIEHKTAIKHARQMSLDLIDVKKIVAGRPETILLT